MTLEDILSDAEAGDVHAIRMVVRAVICRAKGSLQSLASELGASKQALRRWMHSDVPHDPVRVVAWCRSKIEEEGISIPPRSDDDVTFLEQVRRCPHEIYYIPPGQEDRALRMVVLGLVDPSFLNRKRGVVKSDETSRYLDKLYA